MVGNDEKSIGRMVATATGIGQVEFKAHVYPGALRTITTNVTSSTTMVAGNAVTWCATGKDVTGNIIDSVSFVFAGSGGGSSVSSTVLSIYGAATCVASTITAAGSWGFSVSGTAQVRPYAQSNAVAAVSSGSVVVSPAAAATMTTPFLLDLGFSQTEIGAIQGGLGIAVTIAGGLAGGALVARMLDGVTWIVEDAATADAIPAFLAAHPIPEAARTIDQMIDRLAVHRATVARERERWARVIRTTGVTAD